MTKKINLLLINPGNRTKIYQGLGSELAGIENPVWAGLIATFIRRKGYEVRILDANAENYSPEEVADFVKDMSPLLAAVVAYGHNPSASTQVMPSAREICKNIKIQSPNQNLLLVGGHVAALPKRTLEEESVDYVSGGEGPYSVWDLLQALSTPKPDLSKVRDLWYRDDNDDIRSNPPSPMVSKLDEEMPGIAWDLLPMDKYRAHNWHCFGESNRQPYASIYTTLGCPYHCTFCCIQAPFKTGEKALGLNASASSYRLWSPKTVMKEIDTLVNTYGVKNIKFADELFVLHPGHVHGVCDGIIENKYDLNIWAYTRIDSIKEEFADKLVRAGIDWLCPGIEAGNHRVQKDVGKFIENDKLYNAIDIMKKAGINIIGNFIFGLPEDDMNSMQDTFILAVDLNCEFANFYSAMAYPGSKLYLQAVDAKLPLPKEWSGYSQHAKDTLPLPTKYISGEEVLRFRDYAWKTYFTNPRYLKMIMEKFGQKTLDDIKKMTSFTLERDFHTIKY